ncbi:MAG TPA: hypothetical protein DIW23_04790 [Anaerolineae bacterium]|nr:hypothetical protein [Anaerolineae bacterium]
MKRIYLCGFYCNTQRTIFEAAFSNVPSFEIPLDDGEFPRPSLKRFDNPDDAVTYGKKVERKFNTIHSKEIHLSE